MIEEKEVESTLTLYATGVEKWDILPGNALMHYNKPTYKKR